MNPNLTRRGRRASSQTVISSPSRRRLRAPGIRGLLSIAGALGAGVSIAVLAAGGSYAYLNVTIPSGASGGTITAGTSSLTLKRGTDAATSTLTIPASTYANMLPGDVVNQPLTLAGPGNVSQVVTAAITDDGPWETRIATGTCTGTLPSAPLTATPVSLTTLAAGATQTICVQVTLPASAPASAMGANLNYTLALSGAEVSP